MKELYISDLDGTLLNSSGRLSEKSAVIVNSLINNGLNFTIATARSFDSASPLIEKLNLKLPMVLYNGVLVYDPISKVNIHSNFVEADHKEVILNCLLKKGIEPIVFTLDAANHPSAYYRKLNNPNMATYINTRLSQKDRRFQQVENFFKARTENVITIISIGDEKTLLAAKKSIEALLEIQIHFAEDVYYKNAFWLEFTAPKSSKKDGVSFLKNHLSAEKLICFGDNLNDISMFKIADEKFATANARNELKSIATDSIEHCDDHAVAR
ncbi:MAG: HAD family hydrolase, partial [Bacteroidetes bacterium]|nr:HAD family hydrolase [Bacteroidota bacterium]